MPRYVVTRQWIVDGPSLEHVRDLVLHTPADTEDIEEIT